MPRKKTKDLHKGVTKSTQSDNIIVRILKEGITHLEAGWVRFEFIFKERIIDEGNLVHGLVDFELFTITLDPRMASFFALETVLHELTHVILQTGGLGETEESKISVSNEELTVQVSRGFIQLYRLNPKLMTILSELMCKEAPLK